MSRKSPHFAVHSLEPRRLFSSIYVDVNAPGPTGDGLGWNTAYLDLQQAIGAAQSGDTILVADGTYKPTSTTNRNLSFVLKEGVIMMGGYAGYGTPTPNAHDPSIYKSILSGDIGAAGSSTDNSYRVVIASNTTAATLLDGFTITAGTATNAVASGGGLYMLAGSPIISHCIFTGNSATNTGGGIYCENGSPQIDQCDFIGNSAYMGGGGMNNKSATPTLSHCNFIGNTGRYAGAGMNDDGASPTLTYCTFTRNASETGIGGIGNLNGTFLATPSLSNCTFTNNSGPTVGALQLATQTTPTINNCTFTGNIGGAVNSQARTTFNSCAFVANTSTQLGGAIHIFHGSIVAGDCTFIENSAPTGGAIYISQLGFNSTLTNCSFIGNATTAGTGGGVYITGGPQVRLTNCNFTRNTATNDGGGAYNNLSQTSFTNCTFNGNSSGNNGGGLLTSAVDSAVTNCTFVGNTATHDGGGIYNSGAGSRVKDCTLASNSAANAGGGIGTSTSLTVANNILWGNTAVTGAQINGPATTTYSDVQGGIAGTGNIDADPQFTHNPAVGADALWGTFDDDYGNLRLQLTSPAIDDASPAAIPAGITTDKIGNPRTVDIPGVNDQNQAAPDMGAYEAQITNADAGGPYVVIKGQDITLNGTGAAAVSGALFYDWDFDGDGQFDDASGANPVFSTAALPANSTVTVALRVTVDNPTALYSATDTTSLSVVPAILYVDTRAAGLNSGASWNDAFTDLVSTITRASPGQQIHVATGIYKPTTGTSRTVSFRLRNGVALMGGYAGVGAINPDAHDPTAYRTTLSGDIGTANTFSDNSYHVVKGNGTDATAVLDGFYITLGNANIVSPAASPDTSGGGLYVSAGSPKILNCFFVLNTAYTGGGIAAFAGAAPTFTNCAFLSNTANGVGSGGGGAAALASAASLTFTNCTIAGNQANSFGAINTASSTVTITNCIIWGNTVSGSPIFGAATVNYTDILGGFAGTGNISNDPLFFRTPTISDPGDVRLRSNSQCIDNGSNADVPSGASTDLAGRNRIVQILKGKPATVDMGAYERQPKVAFTSGAYLFDAARPSVQVIFSDDVDPQSIMRTDIGLFNQTTHQPINMALANVSYDAVTRTATWVFPTYILPDGNYTATSAIGAVNDPGNEAMQGQINFKFYVLAGDFDRNRKVDLDDLGILTGNWQGKSRTFSQADANYDGVTNLADLSLLSSNWQINLLPAAIVDAAPAIRPAARQPTRPIDGLI